MPPRETPKKSLFKYLKPIHANALEAIGSIRIGTLYGFRDAEALDSERADQLEGVRQYVGPRELRTPLDEQTKSYLAAKLGVAPRRGDELYKYIRSVFFV